MSQGGGGTVKRDLIQAVRFYLDKILSDPALGGKDSMLL